MGLLSAFYILFQSKGTEEVVAETKKVSNQAEKTGDSFTKMANKALKALAPIAGMAALVNRTMNFASQAEEMSYLAQTTGMAVEEFQALSIAAQNYGGTAEGVAGSIQGLNANLQNMKMGKGGGGVEEAAITYGLNITGQHGLATADELLLNVAKRFESLDTMAQIDMGQKLGLDEGTIRLLQTGVANVQKELQRGSKYSLFSEEDVENSRKFQRTLRDVQLGLAQIFGIVARALLPAMTWVADKISTFVDFIASHQNFVIGFFTVLGTLLTALAIDAAIAFAPFFVFVAVLIAISAAIAAVAEDLYAWFSGQESLFGDLFGTLEEFKAAWLYLSNFIKDIWQGLIDWFRGKTLINWGKKLLGIEADVDMDDAKAKLAATQTPLSSIPLGSTSTSYSKQTKNLKIDNVTINTQATNGEEVARDFAPWLQNALQKNATSQVA